MIPPAVIEGTGAWLILAGLTVLMLWIDLHWFARGRAPTWREGVYWSIGWLVISMLAAIPVLLIGTQDDAVTYTTVYLIERSLSLDNLFVFLLLFAYFGIPDQQRPRLLFWGIAFALALRGGAILGGVALIEEFHFVVYILGATLLVLAYRILQGVDESVDPDKNFVVRLVRRVFPVDTEAGASHWFVRHERKLFVTPLFVCLAAMVAADIAFAIDSIPAAFAITRDSALIWMANIFALMGMRALFVLVDGLQRRFRYLDETIAVVLALVAVKLLLEDVVKIGPAASLAGVAVAFVIGIVASLIGDRREAARDASAEAPTSAPRGRESTD